MVVQKEQVTVVEKEEPASQFGLFILILFLIVGLSIIIIVSAVKFMKSRAKPAARIHEESSVIGENEECK